MLSISSYGNFLAANNVLTTAAGITFGQATLQFLKSFVADLVMPLIYMACLRVAKQQQQMGGGGKARHPTSFLSSVLVRRDMQFANFIAELITYVFILAMAYVLISQLRQLFGPGSSSPQQEQKQAGWTAAAGSL